MLQAFYQVITPVHSVFRYLQQIKLVTNNFFAPSLIIFTPLYVPDEYSAEVFDIISNKMHSSSLQSV
jgi:hypothetical protein